MTADWSIHSFGYFYSYLLGPVDKALLNVVNNLANSVNEIAFMLACFWQPSRKLRAKATRSWVVNYVSFCICITSRLNDAVLHRLYLAGHAIIRKQIGMDTWDDSQVVAAQAQFLESDLAGCCPGGSENVSLRRIHEGQARPRRATS